MFKEWRKLIEVAAAIEADGISTVAQFKVCAQAIEDANFIAWTGHLPERNDFVDSMRLRGAEAAERVGKLSQSSGIEKSMEELKEQFMAMPDAKRSEFIRDFKAIPITDPYFEMVQDILAACESVQHAR